MTENKLITDVFVEGARKGWDIAVKNTIPNVLMAFVIIHILKVSGALSVIGKFLGFIMLPLGLPGESIAVFMAAFLSWGGFSRRAGCACGRWYAKRKRHRCLASWHGASWLDCAVHGTSFRRA